MQLLCNGSSRRLRHRSFFNLSGRTHPQRAGGDHVGISTFWVTTTSPRGQRHSYIYLCCYSVSFHQLFVCVRVPLTPNSEPAVFFFLLSNEENITITHKLLLLVSTRQEIGIARWENPVFLFGLEYIAPTSIIRVLFEMTMMRRCLCVCAFMRACSVERQQSPGRSASDISNPNWMDGAIAWREQNSDISIGVPLSGNNKAISRAKLGPPTVRRGGKKVWTGWTKEDAY